MLSEKIAGWLGRPSRATEIAEVTELSACLGSTVGLVRKDNQDRVVVVRCTNPVAPERSFVFMVLCDGMGGLTDGGHCAEIAIASYIESLISRGVGSPDSKRVRDAANAANFEVYKRYREKGGTTIAAILFTRNSTYGLTVGDSRIYALRGDAPAKQIGGDDTVADEIRKHSGTTETVDTERFEGQLTQYLGMGDSMEPHLHELPAQSGFLLTSDGVHSLPSTLFQQLIQYASDPRELVSRLLTISRWCGGRDNGSAICVAKPPTEWQTRKPWSSTDPWLELWDAAGKLELPIYSPQLMRQDVVSKIPDRLKNEASADVKPSAKIDFEGSKGRSRRRDTSARDMKQRSEKKKSSRSRNTTPGPADARQKLQIEILDYDDKTDAAGQEVHGTDLGDRAQKEKPVSEQSSVESGTPPADNGGSTLASTTLPFDSAPAEHDSEPATDAKDNAKNE